MLKTTHIKFKCQRHYLAILAAFGKVPMQTKVVEQCDQLLVLKGVPCEDIMSQLPREGTNSDIGANKDKH